MLTGKDLGYAGGAEVEQVSLGKELIDHGYDVSFVTYNHHHNQESLESSAGIEIIKTYDREDANRTSLLMKYKSVWSALKKTNADIYFHESGSVGVLPVFCHVNGRRFVYRIPSDAVVLSESLSEDHSFNDRIVHALEIKSADVLIAQTEFQKRILMERFGVQSVVIKNGSAISQVKCEKSDPPIVLWVGSISNVKNPELFVELAKSMSDVRFEMIGGATRDTKSLEIISRATEELTNFEYHGFVPYPKINDYFERASIFVNTSRIEGFPNTFIQAWAHYIPVASLNVDPDDVIHREKLGFHSGTFRQLIADLTTLLENEKLRKTMGKNARRYVEREHDIKRTVKKYVEIFKEIL